MDLQQRAIAYLKQELNPEEREAFEAELARSETLRAELEKGRDLLDLLEAANEEANVKRSYAIIQQAIKMRASDIHVLPGPSANYEGSAGDEMVIQCRIDGQLHEMMRLPREYHQPIVDHWKKMADCNITERVLPQDGRISIRYEGQPYELRLNFLPTISGERITARIMDSRNVRIGLENLGLSPAQQEALRRLVGRPYGLLLTSGLAGTGKTTLLYSLLHAIQQSGRRRNILTVENPVEYRLPGLSQTGVNRRAGLTMAAVLRCCLRSDPDVVYASEFRNQEVMELSIEMALVSCLVLGQLHVSSALLLPQRLREMGIVSHLIAQTLMGAVGQRLVRKVCPACAVEYQPTPEALQKAGLSLLEDGPFRRGAGCDACHSTGYSGRIGLFEVWEVEEPARKLIAEEASVETLWAATFGRTGGSLWDDARAKVRQGLTTVEEVTWALFDYPVPATAPLSSPAISYEISGWKE